MTGAKKAVFGESVSDSRKENSQTSEMIGPLQSSKLNWFSSPDGVVSKLGVRFGGVENGDEDGLALRDI